MAWDGTLTPSPMHNEKAKKKEMGRQCTKTNTFSSFFFCFSSDEKLYWITTYIDQLIVISILEIPKNGGII